MERFIGMLLPITLGILVGGLAFAHFFPGNFLMATLGCVLGGLIAYFAFEFGETKKAFKAALARIADKDRMKAAGMIMLKTVAIAMSIASSIFLFFVPVIFVADSDGMVRTNAAALCAIGIAMSFGLIFGNAIGSTFNQKDDNGNDSKVSFWRIVWFLSPVACVFYWPFKSVKDFAKMSWKPICCFVSALWEIVCDTVNVIHNRTRKLVALWAIAGIAGYHIFGGYWFVWAVGCTILCYVHDATVLVKLRRPVMVNGM